MLGFAVGKVSFDALVLCLILYLVARHEADYDFPKLTMVVAGTALGNLVLLIAISGHLPPAHLLWIAPLIQMAFSAFMIKTFCWVSFWKALLVAAICTLLHVAFGLGVNLLMRKMTGGREAAPSLVEQQERDLEEVKAEMLRMAALSRAAVYASDSATTNAVATGAPATNSPAAGPVATDGVPLPSVSTNGPSSPAGLTNALSADAVDWEAARKQLKISGTSGRPGAYVALVNQRVVNAGDVVTVHYGNRVYHWTVRAITLDHVQFEPRDVR